MRTSRLIVCALALAVSLAALPQTALAWSVLGASGETTQNAYGNWYAGQARCAGARCHTQLVETPTVHSNMVTDVQAHPEKLAPTVFPVPNPSNPLFGTWSLARSDFYLQVGSGLTTIKEYVGPPGSPKAAGVVPSGDAILWDGIETTAEGEWEATSTPITPKAYSQSCSGCHNLGYTRPSKQTYSLANGGTQTSATPAAVVGLSIQCEVCHGTGKNVGGHNPGVPAVIGGTKILKAQVCGQCHESGTTAELNVAGAAFGNPNGYTADATLSAFVTPFTTIPTESQFASYLAGIGSKPKFLPNGANYSMNHVYYNEWLVNKVPSDHGGSYGHADPVNSSVATSSDPKCLGCHSGLGFLNRIGAKTPMGSFIVTDAPSISLVKAEDPGISCQVCHGGHVTYSADNKSLDIARKHEGGEEVSCPDCHNWQFEVLDQPVQRELVGTKSLARPAANTRVRHAEKELFSGGAGGAAGTGGMWGVPQMGVFMPESTCQSCHMPTTYSVRVSHRFHVVKPGDAIRWKLAVGQDSCSRVGCHKDVAADFTRTDFQQWIDSIQGGTRRSAAEATGALAAVSSSLGMAGEWTDFIAAQPSSGAAAGLTTAEWKMLQKSAQNADFVIGDASWGVHQPQYAGAGLAKAIGWARGYDASISASVQTRIDGVNGVKVSGNLVGNDGKALVSAQVALEQSTDGGVSWSTVKTATMANTAFTFKTTALSGDTLFRCSYSPDAGIVYRSGAMLVSVPFTTVGLVPAAAATDWVDSNVGVTLGMTDTDAFTMYSLSGATTKAATIYTGPFTIVADGTTTITYWSVGVQGTELPKTQAIRIDKTVPTVSSDAVALYTNSASVNVAGSDVYSGPQYVETSLDGGAWVKSANPTATVSTAALGSHTLRARATNNLGHTGAIVSWSFNVKTGTVLSKSPTASTVSLKRGSYWRFSAVLRASSGAPVAGKIVYLQRSGNGSTWSTVVSLRTSASGAVSRTAKFSTKGSSYWRWYSPADGSYFSATGTRTKVTVR